MKVTALVTMFLLGFATLAVVAGEQVTGEALKELLFGNTEYGSYKEGNQEIKYIEFYRKDGKIRGKDWKYGKYKASFKIKSDGCMMGNYEGTEYDGCYRYEHKSGNEYIVTNPSGKSSTVSIVKGDAENLNR